MLQIKTADHIYSKEEVQDLRESLIAIRNEALKQNDFNWAVALSHCVAVMSCVVKAMEE